VFAQEERIFRKGFEAAQEGRVAGKSYTAAEPVLR
jgi:hypothetical protein